MADEKDDAKGAEAPETGKEDGGKRGAKRGKGINKLLILAPVAAIVLGVGGYFGYRFLSQGKGKAATEAGTAREARGKTSLFSMDPFVVNLQEPGRYLKVTMQMEIAGDSNQALVTEKVPILRDIIITLISSQSYEYVASPEGKLQLKGEILLRTNHVFGKELFRDIYFTDFVMQ